jgi:hypothetical protein
VIGRSPDSFADSSDETGGRAAAPPVASSSLAGTSSLPPTAAGFDAAAESLLVSSSDALRPESAERKRLERRGKKKNLYRIGPCVRGGRRGKHSRAEVDPPMDKHAYFTESINLEIITWSRRGNLAVVVVVEHLFLGQCLPVLLFQAET